MLTVGCADFSQELDEVPVDMTRYGLGTGLGGLFMTARHAGGDYWSCGLDLVVRKFAPNAVVDENGHVPGSVYYDHNG